MDTKFEIHFKLDLHVTSIILMGMLQVFVSYYFMWKYIVTANPWVLIIFNALGIFMILGRKIISLLASNVRTNINLGTPGISTTQVTQTSNTSQEQPQGTFQG